MKLKMLVAIVCVLTSNCICSVIHVPATKPTIQAGINAASNGDTVLVASGTYKENINFNGKAITVSSGYGAKLTIIDGNNAAPCVTFSSGEGVKSVLKGFTLTNGAGSGVSITLSSPTVTRNIITGNAATSGGGIYSVLGSPVISHNTIENNTAAIGGGISAGGASSPGAVITNNSIESNVAYEFGGGVALNAGGTAVLENNTIARNSAPDSQGGGIWMVNESDELIVQNLIYSNIAASGSQIYSTVPQSATGFRLENNTIVSTISGADSAVFVDGYDENAIIANNIIVGAGSETGILCNLYYHYGPGEVEYNDVLSPQGIAYSDGCTGLDGTNGNISANPLFVAKYNFRLKSGSPAIDAGTTSAPDLPSQDFANMPRLVDGTVDMGAYESQ